MGKIRRSTGRAPASSLAAYKEAHWGIEADKVLEVDDPDLPDHLTMMGRLAELEVSSPGGVSIILEFPAGGDMPQAMLLFDGPKVRRLYNVLDTQVLQDMKRSLWDRGRGVEPVKLAQLATWDEDGHPYRQKLRQHKKRYPNVLVKPVGIVERVVYSTAKKDDAKSRKKGARHAHEFIPDLYEHHMGEESGHKPWLGVDKKGRLWWAGGNYHVPAAGVTD